jgi:2-oxoglutarate ferredoxin oxidoreductase subunit alpha
VREAIALLADDGVAVDALRIRAFPFTDDISRFCEAHDRVLVVEQNRDGQMRMLLMAELGVPAAKLVPALSYDGRPMTADFVRQAVLAALRPTGAAAAG